MKREQAKRILIWIGIILLVLLALKGLVVVGKFIGFAYQNAQGGTITELIIDWRLPTDFWAGVFGVAVRVPGYDNLQFYDFETYELDERNLLFDCMERNIRHEVYATLDDPSTLDTSNLYPMTAGEIDAYFGKNPDDFDSATNTFTQSVSFQYGTTTVSTVGTVTYKLGENPPTTFRLAIAKTADDDPVFVALVTNFTDGFNGRLYNYQMLLPVPENQTLTYYFWTDPNDICPEGEGEEPNTGIVYGTVTTTTGIPIPGVIVDVAGVTNITNASGQYRIRTEQGDHNIYAIKTGFEVYHNNVTVVPNNETRHDIILEEEQVPNENTGIGPGFDTPGDDIGPFEEQLVGPGQDEGPGEAPVAPMVQQPQVIEGQDYIISLVELNRKLRLGQFLQERIYIYNFRKTPITVTYSLNSTNLSRLITVDTEELVVEPNAKGEFVLTIFGVGEIGIFNGTIELGGDINASIPVRIEVLPAEQLPIEALHLEVETAEKTYYPNDIVRVKTDIRNMLTDQQYPVRLLFTVQNPEGTETLWTYETNVFLKTAFSLIKSFKLPDDVVEGDYILRVSANYLGFGSGTSTIFNVAVPFWQQSILGLKYWHWLLILLGIAGIAVAAFLIKRNIESKKKYHLKVEYDELPKPGPRSVYVGKIAETDHTTYFNLENFKTHTIVAGSTGGGKSVSAQVIIEEALDKNVAVLVFDPTAQWSGMLRPCKDKTMLSLYPLFGMKKQDAKGFPGNIRQINDAREKIDIRKYVKPGEIQVFACHKLDPKDMDILVANAIREIFHANFGEEKLLKIMFVFDEVHRLLPKFGGSGDGFLQIERACREFRKWGLGVMLISQVLSDFVGTIKANINTEIQMRTRDEGDLERIRQKYGEDVLRSLVKATVGSGMVENPAYNRGKPYFVAFKPLKHSVERLTDEEIEQYNTYNDQIDDLEYSLEQLEEEGVDVFDLKLELKLALDKVKGGNFNMVKIYLEGLAPRIAKQWEKLGKQPKKLERELVDMAAIQAELKKAEAEREKYVAEKATEAGPEAKAEKKEWGWTDDVAPDKILNLKNGMIVINLASLYDEISAMKDADLPNEFLPEPPEPEEGEEAQEPRNTFAEWVVNAIGDTKLGYALAAAKTKEELIKVLEKKKNGEEIPEAKPPEWFLKQVGSPEKGADSSPKAAQQSPAKEGSSKESPDQAPLPQGGAAQGTPAQQETAQGTSAQERPAQETMGEAAKRTPAQEKPEEAAPTPPASTPEPAKQEVAQSAPSAQPLPSGEQGQSRGPVSWEQDFLDNMLNLQNGMVVISLKSLYEEIEAMADEDLPLEFTPEAGLNTFAVWVRDVVGDQELAKALAAAQTKDALLQALAARRDSRPLPAVQPPEWFTQDSSGQAPALQAESPQSSSQPVAAAKSASSLDDLVVKSDEEAFRLENGVAIHGVRELREYLPRMDEEIFQKHVGLDYNHFADWISGVFNDEDLARKVAHAQTKEEMIQALS